jgi:hypothetical protein
MTGDNRENGKTLVALAIGAAIVGVHFLRNRKTLRPVSDELADMAKQGAQNVRRDWSERVREATGGVEDLKGRPFWTAAGLAFASALISACASEEGQPQQKREKAKRRTTQSSQRAPVVNPADKPGAKVYRPRQLPGARFNPSRQRVEDSNGDYLVLEDGHAGGEGQYTYGNEGTGLKAYGAYRYADGDLEGRSVYEVLNLRTELGAAPKLPQSAYKLDRVAEMIRANRDTRSRNRAREVLVVDARPE